MLFRLGRVVGSSLRPDQAAERLGSTPVARRPAPPRRIRRQLPRHSSPTTEQEGALVSLDQERTAVPVVAAKGRWGEYTQLSRQIRQAGLLERRRGWYTGQDRRQPGPAGRRLGRLRRARGLLVAAASPPPTWPWCSPSSPLSATTPGTARSSAPERANDRVGLLHANLVIGLSYGWWVAKHNGHHTNPNNEDKDPDISIAALAFTDGQASSRHGLVRLHRPLPGLAVLPAAAAGSGPPAPGQRQGHRSEARAGPTWSRGCCCAAHVAGYLTALVLVLSPAQGGGVHRWSSRACSACTWAARSPPTTRACPPSPTPTSWTSSDARC